MQRLGSGTGFGYLQRDDSTGPSGRRIIAILGQSNAVGVQDVANVTSVSGLSSAYPNVQLKQEVSATPTEPLTWQGFATAALAPRLPAIQNMGVELSLGRYLDRCDAQGFAMVKMAISGSSLEANWKPSAVYPSTGTTLFNQAVQFLRDAQTELAGYIAAIVWIQGEQDAGNSSHAAVYQTNLTDLCNGLRTYFPSAKFILNELHASASPAFTSTVRAAQVAFAAAVPNVTLVNADDLTLADGLHFDANSYVTLGNRLALAAAQAFGVNVPPVADFSYSATGLSVAFTNASTDDDGTISTYAWDFGDGGTSTSASPTHVYSTSGTYTAQLTVTDNRGGTNSTSKVVALSTWSVDATSGKAIPQNSTEWTAFMSAVNTTLTGLGVATLSNPDFCLLCQDASSNPTDVLGGKVFTASGTGLGYQSTDPGWASKALICSNSGTGAFRCTDAAIPDMSTGAVTLVSWAKLASSTSLARSLLALGTTTVDYLGGQTTTRTTSGANGAAGTTDRHGVVRPYALIGDRPSGRVRGYDDQNKVAPTSSASVTGKGIALGSAGVVSSVTGEFYFAFGWYSALTDAQVKTVMQTAGWTITWS